MDSINEAIRLAAFVRVKEEENILELERLRLNPIIVAIPRAVERIDGIIADERQHLADNEAIIATLEARKPEVRAEIETEVARLRDLVRQHGGIVW